MAASTDYTSDRQLSRTPVDYFWSLIVYWKVSVYRQRPAEPSLEPGAVPPASYDRLKDHSKRNLQAVEYKSNRTSRREH